MKRFLCALLAACALVLPAEAAVRRALPDAMFCDSLPMPGAEFACLQSGAMQTSTGPVALPDGGLFTRITNVGGFKAAVKSHATDRVLVYANGAWSSDPRISHGTQGHIWTDAGELFVHEPCTDCDSQGIRYWDGGPVYGSPTYNPFTLFARAKNVTLIYEWTSLDGITVGQGEEGGAVILYRGKHYLLEPGDARFIQFHKAGNELSVAITKFREREGVLHWLTVGEIEALPLYVPPVVVPVPVPVPPTPTPAPEPAPAAGPSQLATVQKVRAKYPTPLGAHHWEFLVDVAQQTGCKLFRKDGGDRVLVPPLNLSVSQDILICAPEWIDVLGDAETTATPAWAAHPNAGEPEKWIDVSRIDLTGSHAPEPKPIPPDPRIAELERKLADADARLAAANEATRAATVGKDAAERRVLDLEAERDDLKAQLAAERGKPAPRCEVRGVPAWARSFGVKASCVVIQ